MRAADVHARVSWPTVLAQLGIADEYLRKKQGPCPVCGGRDRYIFDNRTKRGDFLCRRCGPGDGFALLQRVHRWGFVETMRRVMEVAGMTDHGAERPKNTVFREPVCSTEPSQPTSRVLSLLRSTCRVEDCEPVRVYLESRRLWPLPADCALRAHAGVDYFEGGNRIGRYPALVAPVTNVDGELVTAHVTYLENGRKLEAREPRKLLSPLSGHTGCAVNLMPITSDVFGIAEGIETALSAAHIHNMPVWAALNTALLQKFEPPSGVTRLVICADSDEPGLLAAARLMERLQGRVRVEIVVPPPGFKDFNNVDSTGER